MFYYHQVYIINQEVFFFAFYLSLVNSYTVFIIVLAPWKYNSLITYADLAIDHKVDKVGLIILFIIFRRYFCLSDVDEHVILFVYLR